MRSFSRTVPASEEKEEEEEDADTTDHRKFLLMKPTK